MSIQRTRCYLLVFAMLVMAGCKKYKEAPGMQHPAYLRIFNDISYRMDATTSGQILPFFTFLLDPKMDDQGVPTGADIMGDFLTTRQNYSLSYPINAGNTTDPVNYDYPGRLPVLTCPPMNGFDLSAWAQIPSGRHRVVFVNRPYTDIPFAALPAKARQKIFIDTTIDFQRGEVYTMHVVTKDIDKAQYGLYLRQESFVHEKFDDDKIYVSFYNLSGQRSGTKPSLFCMDTLKISYSRLVYDKVSSTYRTEFIPLYPDFDVPMIPLTKRFATASPFQPIQPIPKKYFYDYQGLLGSYSALGPPPAGSSYLGTFPQIAFTMRDTANNFVRRYDNSGIFLPSGNFYFTLFPVGNPANINDYDQTIGVGTGGTEAFAALANLHLITNIGGKVDISPTINIIELVYSNVYHMQIQKLYNSPYKK